MCVVCVCVRACVCVYVRVHVCVCVCGMHVCTHTGGTGVNVGKRTVIASAIYARVGRQNNCTVYMCCVERKTTQLSLFHLRGDNTMTTSKSDIERLAGSPVSLAG